MLVRCNLNDCFHLRFDRCVCESRKPPDADRLCFALPIEKVAEVILINDDDFVGE